MIKNAVTFARYAKQRFPEGLSVMLVGSVSRGEQMPVWSDIDIVAYFHDRNALTPEAIRGLRWCVMKSKGKEQMWIKVHTPDSFPDSLNTITVINYHKDGKMLLGKDLKPLLKERMDTFTEKDIKDAVISRMINERFYFRYYYTGMDDKNMELGCTHVESRKGDSMDMLAAQIIDRIIENCQNALYFRGIQATNKRDIVERFSMAFSDFRWKDVPFILYDIRKRWGRLSKKDYGYIFSDEPIMFMEGLTDLLVKGKGRGGLT